MMGALAMRKIFLAFGLMGLGAMSASFAACSSSSTSDDSAVVDSGTQDTSIPTDSSVPDTGPVDAGACATCSQLLSQGLAAGTPCSSSTPVLSAVLSCVCATNPLTSAAGEGLCDLADGGDAGDSGATAACSDLCAAPTTTVPSGACQTCAADNCSTELAACAADGADGG
jgi:hypothetical protein